MIYIVIFVILLALELIYFKIADKFNIIDKPNERSSHSTIVLRGGGIIFAFGVLVWAASVGFSMQDSGFTIQDYLPFLIGLVLVAGVSFVDDIISLPDSLRLVVQFTAAGLAFYQLGMLNGAWFDEYGVLMGGLFILLALIVYVGATNIINFMDGINGITAGYALSVLVPLAVLNSLSGLNGLNGDLLNSSNTSNVSNFFDQSLLMVVILSVLVFCIFNFRPKGKAKCFAGDVGSIGMAFILLFLIGKVIIATGDITYLIFLIIYGLDGVTTICHRILLHENLGEAHRKHSFQLMANELGMSHITVSLIYAGLQLAISLGFVFLCPDTVLAHWIYIVITALIFGGANLLFRKKYYHLHEEYLASLKK